MDRESMEQAALTQAQQAAANGVPATPAQSPAAPGGVEPDESGLPDVSWLAEQEAGTSTTEGSAPQPEGGEPASEEPSDPFAGVGDFDPESEEPPASGVVPWGEHKGMIEQRNRWRDRYEGVKPWVPFLDALKRQFGDDPRTAIPNAVATVQQQAMAAQGQASGMEYEGGGPQMPPPAYASGMVAPGSSPELTEIRESVAELAQAQRSQALEHTKAQLRSTMNAALQRHGLTDVPGAPDFVVRTLAAKPGVTADQAAQEYRQIVDGIGTVRAATKQQAQALTPDTRGASRPPVGKVRPPEQWSEEETLQFAAQALAAGGGQGGTGT